MLIRRTTSLRRLPPQLAFRRFIWAPFRPVHRTGGGLRSVKQVEEQKRRQQAGEEEKISPETHNVFGSKKRDYWFYSDRTAGKGYSHFANEIYSGRPFVWPPLQ
ncbi:Calcium uptake protein 1, partial [Aphelenchoides avenae]